MNGLKRIVEAYMRKNRDHHEQELNDFRNYSFAEAVRLAGLGLVLRRKHSHQRRLKNADLQDASEALLASLSQLESFQGNRSFDELHNVVGECVGHIWKSADLYIYDTALRIGANLRLEPTLVYLQRGSKEGAKALGIGKGKRAVSKNALPQEFQRLKPHDIEDCLCIYKECLQKLDSGSDPTELSECVAKCGDLASNRSC